MIKLSLLIRPFSSILLTVLTVSLLLAVFSGVASAEISEGTFEAVSDSEALMKNEPDKQDWYESLGWSSSLLELDTSPVGTNSSQKAKLIGSDDDSAYLTQEFSARIAGIADIEWDIYVEEIIDIDDDEARDRAGFMLIGDHQNWFFLEPGPNSDDRERFVVMAFNKNNGGTEGTMNLVAQDDTNDRWHRKFTTVLQDLNLREWHNIKVRCYVKQGEYNVYVNGNFAGAVSARNRKDYLTDISFAQLNNGAGTFYVDDVSQINLYTLSVSVDPVEQGSVSVFPEGEKSWEPAII